MRFILAGILVLTGCSGGADADPDAGADLSDAGVGADASGPPGERFAEEPSSFTLPAGGIVQTGFGGLARQSGFENVGDEYWVTRDMTGDGIADLVVTTLIRAVEGTISEDDIYDEPYGYPSSPRWRVYPGTGTGFAPDAVDWTLPQGGRLTRGFNYFSVQSGGERERNSNGLYNREGDEAWIVADLTGDGRPDLVVTGVATELVMLGYVFRVFGKGTAPHWRVYENTGSGFATEPVDWPVPPIEADSFAGMADARSSSLSFHKRQRWELHDMNGDGREDIVVVAAIEEVEAPSLENPNGTYRARPAGHPSAPRWDVYLNDGTGFAQAPTTFGLPIQRGVGDDGLNSLGGFGSSDGDNAWSVADLDGDRVPDLVVTGIQSSSTMRAPGYPGDAHWEFYRNDGSGFDALAQWSLPRGGSGSGGFFVTASAGSNVAGNDAWTLQDMHGDGLPDLVVLGEFQSGTDQGVYQFGRLANDPHWLVQKNDGTGFEDTAERWATPGGGLRDLGFNATVGVGIEIGDQNWGLVDLTGDSQPELAIVADVVERSDSPGSGFTWPQAPGRPGNDAWVVHINVP